MENRAHTACEHRRHSPLDKETGGGVASQKISRTTFLYTVTWIR